MFCKNCGKEIKQGVRFCDACGTLIAQESSENELKMQSATIAKSKKIKRIVLNVLIAIGSLFATLAIALFLVSKPNRMQTQLVKEMVGESLSGMGVEDVSIDSVELGDLEDVEGEEAGWIERVAGGKLGAVYYRDAVVALKCKNQIFMLKFIVETKVEKDVGGDGGKSVTCKVNNKEIYESMIRHTVEEISAARYRKDAEQGDANAQFNLGVCYENGQGVEEDVNEAVRWYRKAAAQGVAEAQLNLGVCYANGLGVAEDATEAVKWFRKAAEQGSAAAQCNLGVCHANGLGVVKDVMDSVKWYRKAAEQGYATAQCNLGVCYENGQGVEADVNEAVKWYRKAAEQGDAAAQCNLGMCYHNGQGVEEDVNEAVKWYRKAAAQGYAAAQFSLGVCYEYGQGVEADVNEAVKWYWKAAAQGFAAAQCNLGVCYENGQGVEEDVNEAMKWYRKAAEQGYDKAMNKLMNKWKDALKSL